MHEICFTIIILFRDYWLNICNDFLYFEIINESRVLNKYLWL